MSDYRIERISEERLKDLIQLYKASFGKTYPINYLKNKFNTQYTGVSFVGYLAYDPAGQPAAYYGVFPCHIRYNGRQILSAQSGDTMTHPAHQGKGLFTKLAKLTYELAKELNI
ncbi:MAG: GNAT family N-acetyltransferase, partial [Bacteroidia bacterium]|nr:GNAT family N-acetyltransferase [Bacteroidia bacterium]